MNKKNNISFVVLLLLVKFGISQNKWPDKVNQFLIQDSISYSDLRAHLLSIDYSYHTTLSSDFFIRQGGNFYLGLNLARLFTPKLSFGFLANVKESPSFGVNYHRLNDRFLNDFNQSYITQLPSYKDSLRGNTLEGVINRKSTYGIHGNSFFNLGVFISPSPDRLGSIVFGVSKGRYRIDVFGPKTNELVPIDVNNKDIIFYMSEIYTGFISFRPYSFMKKGKFDFSKDPSEDVMQYLKLVKITFTTDFLKMRNSTIDGVPIDKFVGEEFLSKYDNIIRWGFKIGIGIY